MDSTNVLLETFMFEGEAVNLGAMKQRFEATGQSQLMVEAVAECDISKYGIVELDAVDKVHRQDAPPAQIRMRLGHVHGRLVRKVTRASLRVIRLAPKMLLSDGILKLGQQPVVRVAGE